MLRHTMASGGILRNRKMDERCEALFILYATLCLVWRQDVPSPSWSCWEAQKCRTPDFWDLSCTVVQLNSDWVTHTRLYSCPVWVRLGHILLFEVSLKIWGQFYTIVWMIFRFEAICGPLLLLKGDLRFMCLCGRPAPGGERHFYISCVAL